MEDASGRSRSRATFLVISFYNGVISFFDYTESRYVPNFANSARVNALWAIGRQIMRNVYLAWLRWWGLVAPTVLGPAPISVGTGKPRLPAAHSSSGYAM